MSAILTSYIKAGQVTLLAKIIAALAIMLEIYALNFMLDKDDYGAFMYALTIILMIGIIIGNPMRSLILYRLSDDRASVFDDALFRSIFGVTILIGFVTTCVIALIGWQAWITALCILAALEMTRVTLCSGLQAMQNIGAMNAFNTILPYVARLCVLAILIILGSHTILAIAIGYGFAFACPILFICLRYKMRPSFTLSPFTNEDFWYGLKTMMTQLVYQNARYIDVILIGTIGVMTATADYVVALKFAGLLLIGKQLTQGLITPRLAAGHVEPEFSTTRFFEMSIAMAGIIGFSCIGWLIIPMIGSGAYTSVQSLFYLCAAAMIPRCMTGASAEFLTMRGHPGWVLAASIIMLKTMVTTAIILIPLYGAIGSALTALAGVLIANFILWVGAFKTERFNCTNMADMVAGCAAIIICLAIGGGALSIMLGTIGTAFVLVCYLFYNSKYLIQLRDLFHASA